MAGMNSPDFTSLALIQSTASPVSLGTTAPPTIATQMMPEPSAARGPSPSLASENIVGNMMELNRPMASSDQPEAGPETVIENTSSNTFIAPAQASTLPGENMRSSAEPMKRPTMAPPQ